MLPDPFYSYLYERINSVIFFATLKKTSQYLNQYFSTCNCGVYIWGVSWFSQPSIFKCLKQSSENSVFGETDTSSLMTLKKPARLEC